MNAYVACIVCLIGLADSRVAQDYQELRNNILDAEFEESLGAKITLTEDEEKVNEILMKFKNEELDQYFEDPSKFQLAKHYFLYKNSIKKSKVYQLIRRMPKGAILHAHSSYMLDSAEIVKLTYEDNLYACMTKDQLQLWFSEDVPDKPCPVKWALLSELRSEVDNVVQFDEQIQKFFSLYTDDPSLIEYDMNRIWNKFEGIHASLKSLLGYRPVREKFIYKCLQKAYEDNIMYVEIRTGLSTTFELDGTVHDKMYMAHIYKNISDKFIEDHPNFIGVKLIISVKRKTTKEQLNQDLQLSKQCKLELPELCAGFDLVGQEDLGQPLISFESELRNERNELGYFFHGGETNWYGTTTDENLADAILLGTKRIGHGYALVKHPALMRLVKEKDIAIEVNLVSNVVLALVTDVRNHPLATYLAMGLPVVLSSDDPGAWDADPLSHDFYVAFVGVASKKHDLRLLKQLAINSIKYSALDNSEKLRALKIFQDQWTKFVQDVVTGYWNKFKKNKEPQIINKEPQIINKEPQIINNEPQTDENATLTFEMEEIPIRRNIRRNIRRRQQKRKNPQRKRLTRSRIITRKP